jgi:hypothetical protein
MIINVIILIALFREIGMPRGGVRSNSGAKGKWKHGKTKLIRVPEELADQILEYAHKLDENAKIESETESKTDFSLGLDSVMESKVLDLSGISVATLKGRTFVFLDNLLKSGYVLKPDTLNDRIITEIYKNSLKAYEQKS